MSIDYEKYALDAQASGNTELQFIAGTVFERMALDAKYSDHATELIGQAAESFQSAKSRKRTPASLMKYPSNIEILAEAHLELMPLLGHIAVTGLMPPLEMVEAGYGSFVESMNRHVNATKAFMFKKHRRAEDERFSGLLAGTFNVIAAEAYLLRLPVEKMRSNSWLPLLSWGNLEQIASNPEHPGDAPHHITILEKDDEQGYRASYNVYVRTSAESNHIEILHKDTSVIWISTDGRSEGETAPISPLTLLSLLKPGAENPEVTDQRMYNIVDALDSRTGSMLEAEIAASRAAAPTKPPLKVRMPSKSLLGVHLQPASTKNR